MHLNKNNKIVYYAIFVAIMLMLRVDLFVISNENSKMNLLRYVVIAIGAFASVVIRHKAEKGLYKFASKYNRIVIFTSLFFLVYTKWLYNYSWYQVFSLSIPFLFCLFSVPMAYYYDKQSQGRGKTFDKIMFLSFCFIIVRFFSWYVYNFTSFNILKNFALEYSGWTRNNLQRVVGGQLFNITFVYYLYKTLSKTRNKISIKLGDIRINENFMYVLFLICYEAMVTQYRYSLCVMVVTCIVSYYFTREKSISKFGIIIIASFSGLILLFGGYLDTILQSVSIDGKYGLSTLARVEGLSHFSELFFNVGHGIGLGFLTNGYGTEMLFYKTSWLDYFIGDLGIMGSFFRYGIFVIGLYGYLFFYLIRITIMCIREKNEYRYIMLPMTIFIVLSSLLSDIYDVSIAFTVPFYVAIASVVKYRLKREKVAI